MNNTTFHEIVDKECGPGNFNTDQCLCDQCDGSGIYFIDGEPRECICLEAKTAVRTLLEMYLEAKKLLTVRTGYVPDSQFLDMQAKYIEAKEQLECLDGKTFEELRVEGERLRAEMRERLKGITE